MITYKKVQIKGEKSLLCGKWIARPVATETMGIKDLAEHMANHNTPYSPGAIQGVLVDMVACIKELVLDGKNVKLDDLAIFYIGLQTTAADTAADFKAATNIKQVRLRARATGNLSNANVNLEATLQEMGEYTTTTAAADSAA